MHGLARAIWGAGRLVAAAIAIVVFGAGVPFLWIWIGSQLQGGTAPSFGGIGVALLGIIASYSLLALGLAWLKSRFEPEDGRPVRYDWNRSLSAERLERGRETNRLEDIVVATTLIVGVICTGWFLLFGNPGVPVGY